MAFPNYPYSLAFLADLLDIESAEFDVQRNDVVSGQGSGRLIPVELAPPLWYADVAINMNYFEEAEVIAAKFRRLHGPLGTFLLYDPRKKYPLSDPTGSIIGNREITITAKGADNDTLSFAGFPPGYVLSPGDKFAYPYGASSRAFMEISDYATASAGGVVNAAPVFPHVPIGTNVSGSTIATFVKPACVMRLEKDGWLTGRSQGLHTSGQGFRAIQKV